MQEIFFITGIGTEVGKTIASAIVTEALEADYFKPVQAGELEHTDTDRVEALISNPHTHFHKSSYALQAPMSPHASAALESITIDLASIQLPETDRHLVVEGAGGLLVPLNNQDTILDLIKSSYRVIVVARHYLGSINHTLLTLNQLQQKGIHPALIFNGNEHSTTEQIIRQMAPVPIIGRINEEAHFDKNVVKKYAAIFVDNLEKFAANKL